MIYMVMKNSYQTMKAISDKTFLGLQTSWAASGVVFYLVLIFRFGNSFSPYDFLSDTSPDDILWVLLMYQLNLNAAVALSLSQLTRFGILIGHKLRFHIGFK